MMPRKGTTMPPNPYTSRFRRSSAPFGRGDVLGGVGEAGGLLLVQPVLAELQPADQRAMDQQVGIAADGRGAMRVARQREPEMTEIVGRIGSLGLAAQDGLVHQPVMRRALHLLQHAGEVARMEAIALGQRDVEGGEELPQPFELLVRGPVMHAVHAGLVEPFQLLGRTDIGGADRKSVV